MDQCFDSELVPIINWAPVAGIWSFEKAAARYLGPTTPDGTLPYGIALSDVYLRDGIVRAEILFENIENITAGIILGFQSEAAGYVMAQLGAYNFAYAISEFDPSFGWRKLPFANAGSIVNLKPNNLYSMEITQLGQKIRMVVDRVRIFELVMPRPLPGNQVGLFTWGKSPIRFENIMAKRERPRAFVAMPFGEPFDTLYHTS